jgi:hypothetical protein
LEQKLGGMQFQPSHYPWHGITSGPNLLHWQTRDGIVMTQSCELVPGRVKVEQVLVCVVWRRSDFPPQHVLSTPKVLEDARRGNFPGFHRLAEKKDDDFRRELRIVDFRKTWSLPLKCFQYRAEKLHFRLLPPYREHLSQSFARFIMRVGLPIDIPSFR